MSENRIDLGRIAKQLKFRQLVVLNAVVNTGSLLKAAEELYLTQPAITRTIRDLETLFECELFERTNRGVKPTVLGQSLDKFVKLMLSNLRQGVDELNNLSNADEGHVIVGTLISASVDLLPSSILLLKGLSPKVIVTVRDGTNDILLPALAYGEIDIVVGRIPDDYYGGITHTALYDESMSLVAGCKHPLASQEPLELADLVDEQWILPVIQSPVRRNVEASFKEAGLAIPEYIVESLSLLTNLSLLNSSKMISMMPSSAAKYLEASGQLQILPLMDRINFGRIGYSTAEDRSLNPAAEKFLECLRSSTTDRTSTPQT